MKSPHSPEQSPHHISRLALAGVAGLGMLAVSCVQPAEETSPGCQAKFADYETPDEWDESAAELCISYDNMDNPEYVEGSTVPLSLEQSGISLETQNTLDNHVAALRPYSENPEFSFLLSHTEQNDYSIQGTVLGRNPWILIFANGEQFAPDNGDVLKTIAFHESAHTIRPDAQFEINYYEIERLADGQMPQHLNEAGNVPGGSGPNGSGECPDGYDQTVYGLFDESSYVDDAACLLGHPYSNAGEFMASALTTTHMYTDEFLENYESMMPERQQQARVLIGDLIGLLQRTNPDSGDLDSLIPKSIQALAEIRHN